MSDPIDDAAEVITRAMFGLTTPSMSREIAYYLHAAGRLVTPAHDAAVAAKALRDAAGEFAAAEMRGVAEWLNADADRIEREGGGDE